MEEIVNQISGHFDYVLLLFLRVSGLIMPSPIFGRKNVPNRIKIAFCTLLTYLFLTACPIPEQGIEASTLLGYFLMCAKELLFGLSLGFVMTMFFDLVYSAGQLMDMQIGFGIVSVYDIQNNSQVPVVGNLLNIILLILFFGVNGHLKLVSIIYSTIERVPIGHVQINTDIAAVVMAVFAKSFVLAVMVAMPLLASGIVLEFIMGVLIRAVPQINMFVIGIPVKIFVGLLVLAASVPVFVGLSNTIFTAMFSAAEKVFDTFGVMN
ncbi:MAG: flagellar biosynthetic protein FliR [Oscillospiraceae bacterium]